MKIFQRILIVRTDRIGDVILTTPAMKAIRAAYPKAWIAMLVAPATRSLVDGSGLSNEVLVDDRRGQHRGVSGYFRLIREIRSRRFDLAIIYHTKKRTNLLCALAGIPNRLGYTNDKFGFLLTHPVPDDRPLGRKHEAQYCMDLLKNIRIDPTPLTSLVSFDPNAEEWAERWLAANQLSKKDRLVALHLGASDPSKRWSVAGFSQLVHKIRDVYGYPFVAIGSAETKALVRELNGQLNEPVLDLTGGTSLTQSASVLRRCALLISNDSGPVHLADAAGIPVVSIFTRNQPGINPERWRPLNPRSRVVSVPPDTEKDFRKAGLTPFKKLEPIDSQQVFEMVDAIFKLC